MHANGIFQELRTNPIGTQCMFVVAVFFSAAFQYSLGSSSMFDRNRGRRSSVNEMAIQSDSRNVLVRRKTKLFQQNLHTQRSTKWEVLPTKWEIQQTKHFFSASLHMTQNSNTKSLLIFKCSRRKLERVVQSFYAGKNERCVNEKFLSTYEMLLIYLLLFDAHFSL